MRQRDAGRTLKAVVARRKAEDGTWEGKERVRDEMREELMAQMRRESGPPKYYGSTFSPYPRPSEMKPREESGPPVTLGGVPLVCDEFLGDGGPDYESTCAALGLALHGDDYEGMEAFPPEDAPPSPWGWFWAILAGVALWGALIVLGMCVWYAIKH